MAELIREDDTLNQGRKKLNNAIKAFNETVVEGDSSVEAAQARVDKDGKTYGTLKERLDTEHEKVTSQLAEAVTKVDRKMDKDTTDISVLQINKNLGKLDQTYMTDEFLQQMAGNTPINAVPADESIDPIKTTFIKTGKNLFNRHSVTPNNYINKNTGELSVSYQYDASDFISVKPNETYTRTSDHQMAFYNRDKEYISGLSGSITFTVPSNAFYVRVTVRKDDVDFYQLEKGIKRTPFEHFKYFLSTGNKVKITPSIGDKTVGEESLSFLKPKKNLFNKHTVIRGVQLDEDGFERPSVASVTSQFIKVKENKVYSFSGFSGSRTFVFYDKNFNKVRWGTYSDELKHILAYENSYYLRITVPNGDIDTFQVEEGRRITDYESFKYILDENSYIKLGERRESTISTEDLMFWVKADDFVDLEDGITIDKWKDSSGNDLHVYADSELAKPVLRKNKYNSLPTLEFTTKSASNKSRMITSNSDYLMGGSNGAVIFMVAEKFSSMDYPVGSQIQSPLFISQSGNSALIRLEMKNVFEFYGRRNLEENPTTVTPPLEGIRNVTQYLSLYEAHINYEKGTCDLYQDGVHTASGMLSSTGKLDENILSYLSVGDISNPNTSTYSFNGNISEIIIYNRNKNEEDIERARKYLREKWDIDTLDGHFESVYTTSTYNEGIKSDYKSLSLIGIKEDINLTTEEPSKNTLGYLYLDEDAGKVYYSSDKYDNEPEFLFEWNMELTGEPCENYIPYISKNGDIIFMKIRDRGNPVVYPAGNYSEPVMIDFNGEEAPMAGLMNSGAEWDYNNNFLLVAEYANPAISGEYQYIWKISYPFTEKENWKKVFEQLTQMEASPVVENSIRHFHTLKRDFYTGAWYANTGDQNYQCKTFESIDDGETWNQVGGGDQSDRMTGLLFLKDGAYWGTDSHLDHALYHAHRKQDGFVDFQNYKRLTWLSMMQPTYQTAYLRNPHGILLLDRAEERLDGELDLTFWSFEKERLYRLDVLNPITGDTGEREGRFGFGNQAVTNYQPINENGIICGATKKWQSRPMTVNVLGNDIEKRIGNLKIEVREK